MQNVANAKRFRLCWKMRCFVCCICWSYMFNFSFTLSKAFTTFLFIPFTCLYLIFCHWICVFVFVFMCLQAKNIVLTISKYDFSLEFFHSRHSILSFYVSLCHSFPIYLFMSSFKIERFFFAKLFTNIHTHTNTFVLYHFWCFHFFFLFFFFGICATIWGTCLSKIQIAIIYFKGDTELNVKKTKRHGRFLQTNESHWIISARTAFFNKKAHNIV